MMKYFFLLSMAVLVIKLQGQTIPVFPQKNEPSKSKTTSPAKTKTVYLEKNATAIVKFLCDADATLYIDGDKKGSLKKDIALRISLAKGEYVFKVVSLVNEKDNIKWNYSITEGGTEKLEEIALQGVITRRVKAEKAEAEAGKRKEAEMAALPKQREALSKAEIEMVNVGSFAIGKYEITQRQWEIVMGDKPAVHKDCDSCPIENVSWNEVQRFIQKLNALVGKNYRLPNETEWQFAAEGGTKAEGKVKTFSGNNTIDLVGWYDGNSGGKSHAVGLKQPNELGIYDMSGNVFEWCSDERSGGHAIRGGSWSNSASMCMTIYRYSGTYELHTSDYGFRLAISL